MVFRWPKRPPGRRPKNLSLFYCSPPRLVPPPLRPARESCQDKWSRGSFPGSRGGPRRSRSPDAPYQADSPFIAHDSQGRSGIGPLLVQVRVALVLPATWTQDPPRMGPFPLQMARYYRRRGYRRPYSVSFRFGRTRRRFNRQNAGAMQ